jgi:hypothetical protein
VKKRKEQRLREFENRLLRQILGCEGKKVTGGSRKLYNEERHDVCCSPSGKGG